MTGIDSRGSVRGQRCAGRARYRSKLAARGRRAAAIGKKRLCIALAMASAAIAVSSAGAIWACVPQPRLVSVQPRSSGPPGSQVTVEGLGFDPGRAEVRWNSSDGLLLATAMGPDFSQPVTIPDHPEGLYHLIVLSREPGGAIGSAAAAAFAITGVGRSPGTPVPGGVNTAVPTTVGSHSKPGRPLGFALGGLVLVILGGLGGAFLGGRHHRGQEGRVGEPG